GLARGLHFLRRARRVPDRDELADGQHGGQAQGRPQESPTDHDDSSRLRMGDSLTTPGGPCEAARLVAAPDRGYSLPAAAFFIASSSFLMSAGVSFGRSIDRVTLLILPVNANGGL